MGYVFFIGLLSLQTRDVLWDIYYIYIGSTTCICPLSCCILSNNPVEIGVPCFQTQPYYHHTIPNITKRVIV